MIIFKNQYSIKIDIIYWFTVASSYGSLKKCDLQSDHGDGGIISTRVFLILSLRQATKLLTHTIS
jgi:hypothetical protein